MTLSAICGFQSGDALETEGITGTGAITAGAGRNGSYAFRANPTTSAVGYIILGGYDTTTGAPASTGWNIATSFARFYWKCSLPASGSEEFFQIHDTADVLKLAGRVTSAGHVQLYQNNGTTQIASDGVITLVPGAWYRINVRCGTGTSALCAISIDGVVDGGATVTSSGLGTSNCGYMYLGKVTNRNSQSVDYYYDSFLVDDTAAIGPGQCGIMLPDSNGTYNTWTSSSGGNKWDDVNEVPPEPIDYLVSTLLDGDAQTMGLQSAASAGISGPIRGAKSFVAIKRDGATNGAVRLRTRSNTTDTDTSTNVATGNGILGRQAIFTSDPATSALWTTSGLDSAQVGVINKSTGFQSRLNSAYLMVDFQPPTEAIGRSMAAGAAFATLTAIGALIGGAQATASAQGTMTALTASSLIGGADSVATASGILTSTAALVGGSAASATASGVMSTRIELVGSALSVASAGVDMHAHAALIGGAASAGVAGAALTSTAAMIGRASAIGSAFGDTTATSSGRASGYSSCLGALVATADALGLSTATGTASGVLTATVAATGSAVATGSASGVLATASTASMLGQSGAISTALALLTARGDLIGQSIASGSAQGALTIFIESPAGSTHAFSSAFGVLTAVAEMAGSAQAVGSARAQTVIDKSFYEALNFSIQSRFHYQIEVTQSLPTQYDNEDFTPPTDSIWCRFSVIPARSVQADMGGETIRSRTPGVAMATLFTPIRDSTQPAMALADLIDEKFRTLTADGVVYRKPSVSVHVREGKWHQVVVTCPFYADDVN